MDDRSAAPRHRSWWRVGVPVVCVAAGVLLGAQSVHRLLGLPHEIDQARRVAATDLVAARDSVSGPEQHA
ncbi:hypothetical protein C6A85_14150, partial [Mycobacterium sp. ITM-2017-0098]